MWCELLDNNKFLRSLYEDMPKLNNVRISEVIFKDEGKTATLIFDLPIYTDKPPEKWIKAGYNTTIIEVDFIDVCNVSLSSSKDIYYGDIDIYGIDTGKIGIKIQGSLELLIISRFAMVQSVRGYFKNI